MAATSSRSEVSLRRSQDAESESEPECTPLVLLAPPPAALAAAFTLMVCLILAHAVVFDLVLEDPSLARFSPNRGDTLALFPLACRAEARAVRLRRDRVDEAVDPV